MNNINLPKAFFFITPVAYFIELIVWISFPQSHFLNGVLGGLWTLGQLGILCTLCVLYYQKIYDGQIIKVLGVCIAAIGALSYIFNYVLGYGFSMNTRILLPLGALLTGIGMTITGVQVLAAKRFKGIYKFAPLSVGLYPFIIMFPLLIITGHPSLTAIMCWGIPWMFLALAMADEN